MPASKIYDVIIVGGGPAGLSCALGLARLRHTAVLFDSNIYRNRLSKHMHVVPTWDHQDPADFRAATRKDITTRYSTTDIQDVEVKSIYKQEDSELFKATTITGAEFLGRTVVLATGITDVFPDLPGYDECWGKGIYHCLFCHGYEEADRGTAGVLAIDDCANAKFAAHFARNSAQLASSVTIYTNGSTALAEECTASLKSSKRISVDSRRIKRLEKGATGADVIVHFEDGTSRTEAFLAHKPVSRVNGPWKEQLGLELAESGDFKVTAPFNETSVKGVFACGDCTSLMKAASVAMTAGGTTAAAVAATIENMEGFS